MKPICGIKTVKGATKLGTVAIVVVLLSQLANLFTRLGVVVEAAIAGGILFLWFGFYEDVWYERFDFILF